MVVLRKSLDITVRFIHWGTWMTVQSYIATHQIVVEMFQFGSKRTILKAKSKSCHSLADRSLTKPELTEEDSASCGVFMCEIVFTWSWDVCVLACPKYCGQRRIECDCLNRALPAACGSLSPWCPLSQGDPSHNPLLPLSVRPHLRSDK